MSDYSNQSDVFIEDALFPVAVAIGPQTITEFDSTRILDLRTTTDNDLVGGQIGMRAVWRNQRWSLRTDVRGFGFSNFADQETIRTVEGAQQPSVATYDAMGMP